MIAEHNCERKGDNSRARSDKRERYKEVNIINKWVSDNEKRRKKI